MAYIPWWQRYEAPTFAERFELGGLAEKRLPFADDPLKNFDFNRNPLGKNQYILRTDEEIQAIIDSYPDNWTKKDFRGEGKLNNVKILTRTETDRPGLNFKFQGKRTFKEANQANIERDKKIKVSQGNRISVLGSGQTGAQFGHVYPIIESVPQDTKMTNLIMAKANRALEGFNQIGQKIAEEQEFLVKNKPDGYKKKLMELNAKAKLNVNNAIKTLGKEYKGQIGYFTVDVDTLEFKKKAGNWANTFAGVDGEPKLIKDMTTKDRKTFEKTISKLAKKLEPNEIKNISKYLIKLVATKGKSFREGGPVRQKLGRGYLAGGYKNIKDKYYKGSDLEAIVNNSELVAAQMGLSGFEELFRLLGFYADGGKVTGVDDYIRNRYK